MILRTHNGFGDAIYQRPVIEAMCATRSDLILMCAWPELYADLPVRFVRATTPLSWSQLNMSRQPGGRWTGVAANEKRQDLRITRLQHSQLAKVSMVDLFAERAKVVVGRFTLPPLPASPVTAKHIAVIRPVTNRTDWAHPARNPRPEYLVQAAEQLRDAGYHVVSVAAISAKEPYLGDVPFAHERFDHGELGPLENLALVRAASLVVTGPGWAVPAALACRTPLVVIAGGAGGTNGPVALVPRWYQGPVTWISPKNFCMCLTRLHECRKDIPDLAEQLTAALAPVPAEALATTTPSPHSPIHSTQES